jgi:CubicO group peptidase (beta-lactamase class C family)
VTGELAVGFTPGNAWGIGCCVVQNPQGVTQMLHAGSFGHGGAYGTQAWIDPVAGQAMILMTQRTNFPNADGSQIRQEFQTAAMAFGLGKSD